MTTKNNGSFENLGMFGAMNVLLKEVHQIGQAELIRQQYEAHDCQASEMDGCTTCEKMHELIEAESKVCSDCKGTGWVTEKLSEDDYRERRCHCSLNDPYDTEL